jgi:hypothetical protein
MKEATKLSEDLIDSDTNNLEEHKATLSRGKGIKREPCVAKKKVKDVLGVRRSSRLKRIFVFNQL